MAGAAGLGAEYLAARWTDDVELIEAASVVAARRRKEEREDLAALIASKIRL